MLTYATVGDFMQMKDLGKSGIVVVTNQSKVKIDAYLERATRFIDRFTRRSFFPYYETRRYPIPYAFYDLMLRRFPSAPLNLDADLLEAIVVNNGITDLSDDKYYLLDTNIYPKVEIALKFPYYWGGLTGSAISRYNQPVCSITGIWGFADYRYPYEFWIDTYNVIPSGGILANTTTIEVDNVDAIDSWGNEAFKKGYMIRVGNELMEVTDADTTTNEITVLRGVRGSTAVAHDEGDKITRWRVVEDIVEACLQVAKTWREADLAAGGRIGVSDASSGVELSIPSDPLNTIKMYARSIL